MISDICGHLRRCQWAGMRYGEWAVMTRGEAQLLRFRLIDKLSGRLWIEFHIDGAHTLNRLHLNPDDPIPAPEIVLGFCRWRGQSISLMAEDGSRAGSLVFFDQVAGMRVAAEVPPGTVVKLRVANA